MVEVGLKCPVEDPSMSIALTLRGLLILLLVVPVVIEPADAAESRSTFGVPEGSVTRYAVAVRSGEPEALREDRFQATVVRPGGEGARRAALLLRSEGGDASKEPQLAVLGFRRDGVLLGDERNLLGPERAELVAALFASVEGPELRPGARWSDEQSLTLSFMPLELPMAHEVASVDGGRLALRSRVTEEKVVATLGYIFRLKSWNREIVFAPGSLRPISMEVELRSENQNPGKQPTPYLRRVQAELYEERTLETEESRSLDDEIARIEAVQKAMDPRKGGGGLFGGLFGGGGDTAPAGDPLKLLAAYEASHPEGFLSSVAPVLRKRIVASNEREARAKALQAKADALLGATAPDFTLEDMKGDKVSLSDLRGKAVLLVFWGYG
jgi:hypothetical protein